MTSHVFHLMVVHAGLVVETRYIPSEAQEGPGAIQRMGEASCPPHHHLNTHKYSWPIICP